MVSSSSRAKRGTRRQKWRGSNRRRDQTKMKSRAVASPLSPQDAGTEECGLTPRSRRAPTAWHTGRQALGLRPILRLPPSAPRCRCRLSSNVRPRQSQSCSAKMKPLPLRLSPMPEVLNRNALAACPLAGSARSGLVLAKARPSRARIATFAAGHLSTGRRRTATLSLLVCGRVAALLAFPENEAGVSRSKCNTNSTSVVAWLLGSGERRGSNVSGHNQSLVTRGLVQRPRGRTLRSSGPPSAAAELKRSASAKPIV